MARAKPGPLRVGQNVAVIDIGSNSARVVVYSLDAAGQLRILASSRAALRLVRDVDSSHRLSHEATHQTLAALRDFRAVALGMGVSRIVALATAALRDAVNAGDLLKRVRRELGFGIEIIDGRREAEYGFRGSIRGLPVEDGLAFDLGGGSMQISFFQRRRLLRCVSLPLGSLRVSQRFLTKDPPSKRQLAQLVDHVRAQFKETGLRRLRRGEELVGTGGTVRNLAKIERRREAYPITRLHGYVLTRKGVSSVAEQLASRRLDKRNSIRGLSAERGDSIVGGTAVIETLMRFVGAKRLHVSGQGVREGVAYGLLTRSLPSPLAVRHAAIASLTSRFSGWSASHATRRATIAAALLEALEPKASRDLREALAHAAGVLDLGRAMDYFDRHQHVADIVTETDLDGFSHEQIALLSAILRAAGDESTDLDLYRPLLGEGSHEGIRRAAAILVLADDIEERCPRGARVSLRCRVSAKLVAVSVQALAAWRPRGIGPRFERAFAKALSVKAGATRRRG